MKKRNMETKYKIIIMAIIAVSVLTLSAFAADPITAINNADTQLRDGISKLAGLAGVGGAVVVFATTRRWMRSVGTLAAGAVLALLIANPNTLKDLMEGAVAWFK